MKGMVKIYKLFKYSTGLEILADYKLKDGKVSMIFYFFNKGHFVDYMSGEMECHNANDEEIVKLADEYISFLLSEQ